jgi:hypothetical protein
MFANGPPVCYTSDCRAARIGPAMPQVLKHCGASFILSLLMREDKHNKKARGTRPRRFAPVAFWCTIPLEQPGPPIVGAPSRRSLARSARPSPDRVRAKPLARQTCCHTSHSQNDADDSSTNNAGSRSVNLESSVVHPDHARPSSVADTGQIAASIVDSTTTFKRREPTN